MFLPLFYNVPSIEVLMIRKFFSVWSNCSQWFTLEDSKSFSAKHASIAEILILQEYNILEVANFSLREKYFWLGSELGISCDVTPFVIIILCFWFKTTFLAISELETSTLVSEEPEEEGYSFSYEFGVTWPYQYEPLVSD